SEVGVHDAAHGGVGVVGHVGQVGDGVVQTVDIGTHGTASSTNGGQQSIQGGDHAVGSSTAGLDGTAGHGSQSAADAFDRAGNVDFQGLFSGRADLQGNDASGQLAGAAGQQVVVSAVAGVPHDVVQLRGQLLEFCVE